MTIMRTAIARLLLLLVFYDHVTGLIIPEELPTILSLIYSNIPPIKKGTDSRLGVGFRLGEHADFQILFELGPQSETDTIGTNDAKRRRDVMLSAAMRGELGPLAQAVAKYQIERRIQTQMDQLKTMEEKLRKIQTEIKPEDQNSVSSNWLTKWKQEVEQSSVNSVPLNPARNENDTDARRRIGRPPVKSGVRKDKLEELTKLYKPQNVVNNETST